jgi:HEAT repeat protein
LQSLQAASFSVVLFESCRSDYIATLREVAEDPDAELRQRVLGILAREKDGFAQKKLIEGLKNPEKALVPPEKALQLLSYDVHAEAYSIARAIVSKPPNASAKREALRLLAADATAAPVFEKILRDKNESREIRQISASALQALKPERLQAHAREILLDTSEYADIRGTSLTAIAQFGDAAAVGKDEELLAGVGRLCVGKAGSKIKQSARRFLSKYGR